MNSGTPVNKILILAASPKGMIQLRLNEELREIKSGLRRATAREQFLIESAEAAQYRDIRRSIMDFKPQIVHFCGHGEGENGLVFEDGTGKANLVDGETLAGLFELFTEHVKCVVLNACYSEFQAQAITQHIDYVIGMSQAIGDRAAIEFAVGFYDGLGAGRSFEDAYKFGKNAIQIPSIAEHLTPKLLRKKQFETEGANTTASNFADTVEVSTSDNLSSECGIDYTRLRDLLAAGKWKEADQETLAVMLKAAGKDLENWLTQEDIKNFACTDLRTIDTLWTKYSKGNFGFSVQKEIWQRVGGNPGVFNEEAWFNFGERVGWRTTRHHQILFATWTTREWSYYSQISFNQNAPQGHLPRMWDEWRGGVEVSSIAARLVKCNL